MTTSLHNMTTLSLSVLLRGITGGLPGLAEDSIELRNAHLNLQDIRRARAQAGPRGPPSSILTLSDYS